MLKFTIHYTINDKKTITLTDKQFDTLFEYLNIKVSTIVNASVDYQDSELLQEWEDLFDTHSVLVRVEEEYQNKLAKARAKQPKAEW